ncbi:unnamed protein product [Kuraishia capsulata CBS 1993]|uniref:Uncharacterized protein n=1 Tax=Kuraishia capsulata CBS 1993 TaxID=1382522 RepID=W6MHR7_9ASCO|nr:uncharacterized protein KUCA_T00001521001 [Kuraishia capsulata CBS 1993]CDK25551.1 unnamed protein product [Kuraishia capsulata CBS 1993]
MDDPLVRLFRSESNGGYSFCFAACFIFDSDCSLSRSDDWLHDDQHYCICNSVHYFLRSCHAAVYSSDNFGICCNSVFFVVLVHWLRNNYLRLPLFQEGLYNSRRSDSTLGWGF